MMKRSSIDSGWRVGHGVLPCVLLAQFLFQDIQ